MVPVVCHFPKNFKDYIAYHPRYIIIMKLYMYFFVIKIGIIRYADFPYNYIFKFLFLAQNIVNILCESVLFWRRLFDSS